MTEKTKYTLHSKLRPTRPKPHQLLTEGIIPGTVYGHGITPKTIQFEKEEFDTVYKGAEHTSIVDLIITDDNTTVPVLIHQLQKNHLTGATIHVELFKVSLTEKITTEIPLEIVGTAPAMKNQAIPLQALTEIEVECFPQDLVSVIEVDISGIMEIDDSIFVKDLPIPANITVLTDSEELVFKALAKQEEEEEEEEAAEEGAAGEPEVLTEKKEEDKED